MLPLYQLYGRHSSKWSLPVYVFVYTHIMYLYRYSYNPSYARIIDIIKTVINCTHLCIIYYTDSSSQRYLLCVRVVIDGSPVLLWCKGSHHGVVRVRPCEHELFISRRNLCNYTRWSWYTVNAFKRIEIVCVSFSVLKLVLHNTKMMSGPAGFHFECMYWGFVAASFQRHKYIHLCIFGDKCQCLLYVEPLFDERLCLQIGVLYQIVITSLMQ